MSYPMLQSIRANATAAEMENAPKSADINSSVGDTKLEDKEKSHLPPCLVCGAASSGVHFGAITCESCKVFFRRSLMRKYEYSCFRNGACPVNGENRSRCAYCRFKKCVETGMSKEGVKKGRYTTNQKKDIKELACKLEHEAKSKAQEEEKHKELHHQRIKDTVQRLKKLHDDHQVITPEVEELVKKGEIRYKKDKQIMQEFFGPMPHSELKEFYETTGIDLSGFISMLIPCVQTCSVKWVANIISYVKNLPEFMDLSLPDRITTLKGASSMWVFVTTHKIANSEEQSLTCIYCGACFSAEHYHMFDFSAEFTQIIRVIAALQQLNLTEDEVAMLQAFMLFDTSQNEQDVEEPEKITDTQNLFLECLLHVLKENRGENKFMKTFTKIIDIITEARTFMHRRQQKLQTLDASMPHFKCPRIVAEVYNMPEYYIDDLGEELDSLQLE